jgi:hypothetical protein
MENYSSGDIVLFCYRGWSKPIDIISHIIEWFSPLPYSHCGIFLKSPTYIDPKLSGNYIWESAIESTPDAETDKIVWGVKLTPIEDYIDKYDGSISVRRLLKENKHTVVDTEAILKIYKNVFEKPYDLDPMDWIRELFNMNDPEPQKTNRFWCSAFVGYFLTKLGVLPKDIDWSILKPADFAENTLDYQNGYSFGDIEIIQP